MKKSDSAKKNITGKQNRQNKALKPTKLNQSKTPAQSPTKKPQIFNVSGHNILERTVGQKKVYEVYQNGKFIDKADSLYGAEHIADARFSNQRKDIVVKIKDHKDNKGGHPHVVLDNIEDKHVSVGLTSDRFKGNNHPNYRLKKDPLNKQTESYMRRQAEINPIKEYYNERTGNMDECDYNKAKQYGEKAKEKYLKKKNNDRPNT